MFPSRKPSSGQEPARERGRRFFGRLGQALKARFTTDLADVFSRHKVVDEDILEEIETLLLSADVGVEATERIVSELTARLKRKQLGDADAVMEALQDEMLEILRPVSQPLRLPDPCPKPFVILMVGVNGTGKTTTIGKLAKRFKDDGRRVMLAAGDTFRAAAIEQLQGWGERIGVPVVGQHTGADAASVIYDALVSARAREVDVLIADTAGRLHTQRNLMDELKKVHRVIRKFDPYAPHETMLIVDAGTGQNALTQSERFHEAVQLTGIALTKLDGTARGGIVFAVAEKLGLPIRFVGVGEALDDLQEFDAGEFVHALLRR
ncbi:MAG: signal recognition particle-docking protein FtsY [Gammaproteobacteria bacterium]|nr:signal recognition particle-docking protein FtsY [Gammaproteobacteria bacterium]NIR82213.1 signal recognition particle-docking protein FtsY [Gammaproteobacteria bacterium]NIR90812.1 signal recognition particle-docking protein FtsY [Gammaproteobacteria bacterium]NIU03363.1 signal recognition particle-docking protein FtsY [Gammaproteobacteria bacterium]NIV50859.1 signal recognition particle-docking protein FtsY [Gammaproteobacteria bacterium]